MILIYNNGIVVWYNFRHHPPQLALFYNLIQTPHICTHWHKRTDRCACNKPDIRRTSTLWLVAGSCLQLSQLSPLTDLPYKLTSPLTPTSSHSSVYSVPCNFNVLILYGGVIAVFSSCTSLRLFFFLCVSACVCVLRAHLDGDTWCSSSNRRRERDTGEDEGVKED